MTTSVLAALSVVCLLAALVYVRSARLRYRVVRLIDADANRDVEAHSLAFSAFRKEAHSAIVYALLAPAAAIVALVERVEVSAVFGVMAVPAVASLWWARLSVREARMARNRWDIERRAGEALEQEQLAPKAWAARLAPEEVPDFSGFEIGRVYQAGSGLMAGDFFDVYRVGPTRVAAVIGDVAGHGIESSITAFQAKPLISSDADASVLICSVFRLLRSTQMLGGSHPKIWITCWETTLKHFSQCAGRRCWINWMLCIPAKAQSFERLPGCV